MEIPPQFGYIKQGTVFGVLGPRKAVASVAEGQLHMLSGGSLRLTCDVPADPSPLWTFKWFFNGNPLTESKSYSIWKARVLQSGNYTCSGDRESELSLTGFMESQLSAPLRIDIDGKVRSNYLYTITSHAEFDHLFILTFGYQVYM